MRKTVYLFRYSLFFYWLLLISFNVFDDEQHFARFDEAELAARGFFDGGRVFAEAAGGFAQLRVFGARPFERALQRGVFTARLEQREQPFSPAMASTTMTRVMKMRMGRSSRRPRLASVARSGAPVGVGLSLRSVMGSAN
jgi:hypothetical protein